MRTTKKEIFTATIKKLMMTKNIITWGDLNVNPLTGYRHHLSYDGKIIHQVMNELGIEYVRYSDKFSDQKMHGNTKLFYVDIKKMRLDKLKEIESNITIKQGENE